MEHFYQNLEGEHWFDYDFLYKEMVEKFPSGAVFVELGAWKGKSASFMGVEIINSGKRISFYCVDSWEMGNTRNEFLKNIEPAREAISVIDEISWEAADLFPDESISFCFVDAAHDYDSVKKDLLAWLPKIKKGGIIAGHDYSPVIIEDSNRVHLAVQEVFDKFELRGFNVWLYKKPL